MYNYTVMRQVPPRIVKFDYMEPPSTTTIAAYIYGRKNRNNKYPAEIARTSTLDLRACENDFFHYYRRGTPTSTTRCTSTDAANDYFHDVP